MNTIEIRGLTKSFLPKFRLGPLQMNVPQGSIYGFIGPNGAGKTTTIDLLLGIGKCDSGSIAVFGKDHQRDAVAVKQRIGYVSPELNYAAWGKVKQAVQFMRGFYPDWDQDYCDSLMQKFRLGYGDRIATLSFGSKIKLALLLALAHRPELLILDEPTVGLDAVSKTEMFTQLLHLVREGGRTVLISSHGLSDIERFADHVGFIKDGQMLLEGATDEIVGRFRITDFLCDNLPASGSVPGCTIVARENGRCRALVDSQSWIPEAAARFGLSELASKPVTLEELFVTLAKD